MGIWGSGAGDWAELLLAGLGYCWLGWAAAGWARLLLAGLGYCWLG